MHTYLTGNLFIGIFLKMKKIKKFKDGKEDFTDSIKKTKVKKKQKIKKPREFSKQNYRSFIEEE